MQWIQFVWVKKKSRICIAVVLPHSHLSVWQLIQDTGMENLPQAATMSTEERSSKIVNDE